MSPKNPNLNTFKLLISLTLSGLPNCCISGLSVKEKTCAKSKIKCGTEVST